MGNKTKCYDFFPSARRKLILNDYQLLETGSSEKRQKLTVEDVLSGESLVGLPTWIADPFLEMQKEKSLTGRTPIAAMCEGMTLEIFSTAKHKRRAHWSTGVLATSFALVPSGEAEKRDISLIYSLYIPANIDIHQWAWDHYRKVFFASFEYSQTEMAFDAAGEGDAAADSSRTDDDTEGEQSTQDGAGDDGAEKEEQDDDEDSAAAIAQRARKPFNARAVQSAVN